MAKRNILFYLSHGHRQVTNGVRDMGAQSGKFVEGQLTYELTKQVNRKLLALRNDRKYKVSYPERKGNGLHLTQHLRDIVNYVARYRVVAVDIHFNAGGGVGCECWIPKGNKYARDLATCVLKEMVKIGRPMHGGTVAKAIHTSNDFAWCKAEGVPMIFEAGFVDNVKDRKDFDTDKEIRDIGLGIAKGLVKYYDKYK